MRMLTYFINRGGKGLSADRRRELERAKKLLRARGESKGWAREKGRLICSHRCGKDVTNALKRRRSD
jgi:hypothetical protein